MTKKPRILTSPKDIFLNTITWGFLLWLFGYMLGFVFFAFVPKEFLGWYIMPFGIVSTLWVLFKKIERKELTCYLGLSIFWTLIAIGMDYLGIVLLLQSKTYYKIDVYVYYMLTFILPLLVGQLKMSRNKN